METQRSLATVAASMLDAGLCVLPARCDQKRPSIPWKQFQSRLPRRMEVDAWFANGHKSLCLVTGAVSGNLELLDFDLGGELFEPWSQHVQEKAPGLLDRLVVETTPSNGWHVAYRCQSSVSGNLKLAQRCITVSSKDSVSLAGKQYIPRRDGDGNFHIVLALIETRGEGGLFLCDPSPGYELIQGDFSQLPVLTPEERDLLLEAAWSLTEYVPEPATTGSPQGEASVNPAEGRPGDDFNERGDLRALLTKHGWTQARSGDNELWCRPGKKSGWSATLKDRVFYVFSSSAAPFEPNRAYSPFHVYALLEHNGDFASASSALRQEGFGGDLVGDSGVDLSGILEPATEEPVRPANPDPGPIPDELLHMPGFVSDVMEFCLATAPYPERTLAFAGALSLQCVLAGRKVTDEFDSRTNLYLLGLANSGAGKNHPRKINQQVLFEIGMGAHVAESFASGEGIEDRVMATPAILFQTDEIDSLLSQISLSKEGRHDSMVKMLLTFYTSSDRVYHVRAKANREGGDIDQPCLCLFGTAIPKNYYEALSMKMLSNGFFARMIVLETRKRCRGQRFRRTPIPEHILDVARWWANFSPSKDDTSDAKPKGNLEVVHPDPIEVPWTPAALERLEQLRNEADDAYAVYEDRDETPGMAIWSRMTEKAARLALVYACSENHEKPEVSEQAIDWAARFVMHQTRRMLYMADLYVSENEFDARCKRMLEVLGEWKSRHRTQWMPYRDLSRKLRWSRREFDEVRDALVDQERIELQQVSTAGRPKFVYRAK